MLCPPGAQNLESDFPKLEAEKYKAKILTYRLFRQTNDMRTITTDNPLQQRIKQPIFFPQMVLYG
jgi:hypothetical protein